ncbi:Adenylosuccinate synthetase [Shigella dysenteriae 1617]|uniref:Adenylosuccinate synthetase n=1 Tax=Shigella dysenteriae 1617 TaxID=754093 RepID=A0A0A7A2Z7_SHIDY|nr:Adenylosuccinate synthetase [Shigella dysenteriae 1617]
MLSPAALMKEMKELEDRGIPVRERLLLSEACPLILDYHVALDNAREKARGAKAIGTTGRGIGPAYEDKVARRGLRVGDLFDKETFAEKLKEVMEYHNFQLVNYYKAEAVDYQKVLDDTMAVADILTSMVVDVSDLLDQARQRGDFVMFEGAQGTLLDIDHGTYPYVTSSNTTAGGVATGSGLGPRYVDYVLGILKAYSTRVGAGPFPTELFDETGEFLCKQGNEFGATYGSSSSYRLAGHRCRSSCGTGTLLDIDHGTYPYVTSSNTLLVAWRPVPAWARVMLITFWVSSKLTPLVWVQVHSRLNCLMKLASSSASRVTNSAQLRVVVVVPAGWTPLPFVVRYS